VVFAQYLLAWFWALDRDRARLRAARERALELPLGAGALAGNHFGVDRNRLAREGGVSSCAIEAQIKKAERALTILTRLPDGR
jgi:argininosuccinate lyase